MSKFKVGDKVRIIQRKPGNTYGTVDYMLPNGDVGKVGTITEVYASSYQIASPEYYGIFDSDDLELITNKDGDKPMARRTFKQTKSSPTHPKGTLFQEQCEDGTQPYVELGQIEGVRVAARVEFIDRALVEDQPEWFVEVFKVEPEYMTAEELEKYKAFLGQKKRGRPTKLQAGALVGGSDTIAKATFGGQWTEERRKAQSRRMKKMWKQKRAA